MISGAVRKRANDPQTGSILAWQEVNVARSHNLDYRSLTQDPYEIRASSLNGIALVYTNTIDCG